MHDYSLARGIGPGERNDKDDLAGFGRGLERATRLDPWLPHAWPMAAFPEAHTSDGYMPGFGGALRGFQIDAGLYPDGVARPGGPTERALSGARPGSGRQVDFGRRGLSRRPARHGNHADRATGGRRRKGGRATAEAGASRGNSRRA